MRLTHQIPFGRTLAMQRPGETAQQGPRPRCAFPYPQPPKQASVIRAVQDGVRRGRLVGQAGAYRPQDPDPAYATQLGSQADVREQHLDNLTEEFTDSSYETCEVRTLRQWSVIVGSAPNPEAVARRYAAVNYPPAERTGARAGCRNALIDQLAVRGGS